MENNFNSNSNSNFDSNAYRLSLTKEISTVYGLVSAFLENPVPSSEVIKKTVDYLNQRSKTLNYKLFKLNGGE